ncbi:putative E3 ubiquitin-protein ligase HERC4 [Fasciola hepatica]|uniref:HECT-type E3 ubiquitin transferase n=1 Tax=Fasciola hepatica TaxID=6192 RepID=A0A4E0S3T6_FASHE|nr:putative E3 ubiquitin-protein ligase HERC4 [Fasciola hepatica]
MYRRTQRFFSYCDYPFVFDAPTKARMLNMEARLSMVAATDRAQQNTILDWLIHRQFSAVSPDSPYLKLTVRRDKLIQDTLTCLAIAKPSDFRKLLRVEFDGEEAVDEGGVLKTMESENVFQLIGILCGLAIYNSVIVDLSFPLGMFRKLLGEKPELDDLKELDPVVGRSLQQLLDYEEADFTDVFCSLTFSLDIDFFGANRHIDLIENGANIPVNQENKALYVEKYVDYVFNRSCERPYKAFEGGFMQVCSGDVIHFFRPMELQSLVVGLEVINWNELRENTAYQGVYWDHHPVIEWFWTVLLIEFSIEDKKKFLRFLTGCDRVPIVGFSSLKITIQPNNSGDDYLPVAHTCANLLDLPLYSSKEILARKLALAIQQTEGFGLV